MRIGIVGLGLISKYFIKACDKSDFSLIALCDKDRTKAVKGYRFFTNYDQFLSAVDTVCICLPNNLHFRFIIDALNQRKHVLCEKPLVLDIEEANKASELAKSRGVALKTAFHRKYNVNLQGLRKPDRIHLRYLENIEEHSSDDLWVLNPKVCGGGCIIDNGSNLIDIARFICGDIKILDSKIGWKYHNGARYEANAYVSFEYEGGKGTMELDWHFDGEIKDAALYYDSDRIHKNMLDGSLGFKSSLWHEYEKMINEFYQDIVSGKIPYGEHGIIALNLVQDIFRRSK